MHACQQAGRLAARCDRTLLLTRAYDTWADKAGITLLPAKVLYPATSAQAKQGLLRDPEFRARALAQAYAVHHWAGTWLKDKHP